MNLEVSVAFDVVGECAAGVWEMEEREMELLLYDRAYDLLSVMVDWGVDERGSSNL